MNQCKEHLDLRLPEVLHDIFGALMAADDRRSLYAAVRVCRAGASVGLPLLWRSLTAYALTHVSDPLRRQQYANWIHALIVDHNSSYGWSCDLKFPRLSVVRLRNDDDSYGPSSRSRRPADAEQHDDIRVSRFFQQSLDVIDCDLRQLNTDTAQRRLAAECLRLRHLCLLPTDQWGDCVTGVPHETILAILGRLPSLELVDLRVLFFKDDSGALFRFIAARNTLKSLRVGWLLLRPSVSASGLQDLRATVNVKSLPVLLSVVPAVARLSLFVTNDLSDELHLAQFALLRHLRALDLNCRSVLGLPSSVELGSLAQLPPQLRVLRIHLPRSN
jgi:hypothetical protein